MRILLMALVGMGLCTPALACSCALDMTRESVIEDSDVVFTGQVEKVETEGFWNVATLKVTDVAKGTVDEEVKVQTASQGAACGIGFEVGKTVELATIKRKDRLHASLCTQIGLNKK